MIETAVLVVLLITPGETPIFGIVGHTESYQSCQKGIQAIPDTDKDKVNMGCFEIVIHHVKDEDLKKEDKFDPKKYTEFKRDDHAKKN